MAYKGPDISAWQGNIDIKALASQVDFFIFRCYAGSSKDSKVDRNVQLAIESGKPYGLYIYSYALNTAQAKEEAQRVVNLANSYSIKPAFLCIDMEDADGYKRKYGMPSNQTLKEICTIEGEIFENAGYYAMVYASSSWWKNQLSGLTRFDKWVAHWPTSGGKQKGNATSPDGENANNCGIWQFTSQGKLNGYNGNLDMNYAYKEFVLNKNGNNNPTPIPTPVTPNNNTTTYTVKKGDCLSTIGSKLGVKWQDIASVNNIISPYIIHIGQVLIIPGSTQNSNNNSNSSSRKVGDVVTISGVYTSSSSDKKLNPAVKTGTITKILTGAKNPYLLNDGNIGWVNESCIVGGGSSTSNTTTSFSKGQTVTLKTTASKYCTGQTIPSSIKGKKYTIMQVGSGNTHPDGVLLKEIMSWVYKKDVQ